MRCDEVAEALAAGAEGPAHLDLPVRAHVEQCLRCQADLVQYRRLLRAMRSLRTEVLEPAPGLLAEILASVEEAGERHAVRSLLSGRRVAYLGGLAAATAAGAGAAIVIATRSRRGRLPLAG
jgi:threonine dehydrogenase-like Zn-dependent dehydrogenase